MNKENTVQGVAEPPGPVGGSSGSAGSTRQSSSNWKNGRGKVHPRASSRAGKTTGDQMSKMESGNERPRAISE